MKKAGRRPMRSATWPNTKMPTAMPAIVTIVHTADCVSAKPNRVGQIVRQPDHHAVVAEVLHRTEDDHADAELGGLGILHQQMQRRLLRMIVRFLDEHFRLVERIADEDTRRRPGKRRAQTCRASRSPAGRSASRSPRRARRAASRGRHRTKRAPASTAGHASATSAMPMPNSPPSPTPAKVR